MNLDLGKILDSAAVPIAQAIATSGTTIAQRTPTEVRNHATGMVTKTPTLGTPTGAIVITVESAVVEIAAGLDVKAGDWKITCLPSFTLAMGDEVQIVTCRDARLIDGHGRVVAVVMDSAAVVTRFYVRPEP